MKPKEVYDKVVDQGIFRAEEDVPSLHQSNHDGEYVDDEGYWLSLLAIDEAAE